MSSIFSKSSAARANFPHLGSTNIRFPSSPAPPHFPSSLSFPPWRPLRLHRGDCASRGREAVTRLFYPRRCLTGRKDGRRQGVHAPVVRQEHGRADFRGPADWWVLVPLCFTSRPAAIFFFIAALRKTSICMMICRGICCEGWWVMIFGVFMWMTRRDDVRDTWRCGLTVVWDDAHAEICRIYAKNGDATLCR